MEAAYRLCFLPPVTPKPASQSWETGSITSHSFRLGLREAARQRACLLAAQPASARTRLAIVVAPDLSLPVASACPFPLTIAPALLPPMRRTRLRRCSEYWLSCHVVLPGWSALRCARIDRELHPRSSGPEIPSTGRQKFRRTNALNGRVCSKWLAEPPAPLVYHLEQYHLRNNTGKIIGMPTVRAASGKCQ